MVSARNIGFNIAGSVVISSLSVVGLQFATQNTTPSGRLGTAECATSGWVSATSVFCMADIQDPLVVTVAGSIGTITLSFTYDGMQPCLAPVLPLDCARM